MGPMALVVYFPWHRDQTEGTNGSCRLLPLTQRPDRWDQWLLSFTSPGTDTRQKGPMALVVYFPWHRDQTEGTNGSCRLLPLAQRRDRRDQWLLSFTSPGTETRQKGPMALSISSERHRRCGLSEITHAAIRRRWNRTTVHSIDRRVLELTSVRSTVGFSNHRPLDRQAGSLIIRPPLPTHYIAVIILIIVLLFIIII